MESEKNAEKVSWKKIQRSDGPNENSLVNQLKLNFPSTEPKISLRLL